MVVWYVAVGPMKVRYHCIRSRKIHISHDNKLFSVLLEYKYEINFFHYLSFAAIKFFSLFKVKVMAIIARVSKRLFWHMISYKAMSNFMQLFPVLMMMTERTEILYICHGRTTLYHSLLFHWLPHGNIF